MKIKRYVPSALQSPQIPPTSRIIETKYKKFEYPWPTEPLFERLEHCRITLFVHGIISLDEATNIQIKNFKLRKKMEGW